MFILSIFSIKLANTEAIAAATKAAAAAAAAADAAGRRHAGQSSSDSMSLSEIANTLRSAVMRNLGDSEWLQKLHEFRAETEHRDRNGSKERGYSNGSFSVGGLQNIRSGRLPKNQVSRIAANSCFTSNCQMDSV